VKIGKWQMNTHSNLLYQVKTKAEGGKIIKDEENIYHTSVFLVVICWFHKKS